ncbi:hypothetical protein [Lutibacter sp.]
MPDFKSPYKILPNHNLIIEYYSGDIDFVSFMNFKKKLIAEPLFTPTLNILIHFKNATFKITDEEINKYIHFSETDIKVVGKRKIALITKTPNQVVVTTLFKMIQRIKSKSVEIFSTKEAALRWLNIKDLSTTEVTLILNDLHNKTLS